MTLTLAPILLNADISLADAIVIRHSFVSEHEDTGLQGINANSTHQEILQYTSVQSADSRKFPVAPPRYWVVFIREGGDQARFWGVVENRGEVSRDAKQRVFDLVEHPAMLDLKSRLVIGWRSPRTWWMRAVTASSYPVMGIADAEPIPFPGFESLILDYAELQAVMRENRYATWRTALSSVLGIYLITDLSDGRQYVGKADGIESVNQRWQAYASNGHGGNVELRRVDPSNFRFSILRVFDPATARTTIDEAESHFKMALATRLHGLNRN